MKSSEPSPIPDMEAISRRPFAGRLGAYARLCGPGWLQGAITLGSGSLAGALYLGVIMGFHMLWLQPLAMILGVVMLSAIAYVTLSTGQRPFAAINRHVSPILGWAWILATIMANLVWALPQFSLGTAALSQNLIPALSHSTTGGKFAVGLGLLAVSYAVVWFSASGARGIASFENILKVMVALIVLSFFGVVLAMANQLPWKEIMAGFIPDFSLLTAPAPGFAAAIETTADHAASWRALIVEDQKDKMIAAFATAVGINMTFLLPYSMLRKGWGKPHRGLAIFDLATGLIVPFVLATGCIVIASASRFHAQTADVLEGNTVRPEMAGAYQKVVDTFLKVHHGSGNFAAMAAEDRQQLRDSLPPADRSLAAMLANRDAFNLASALTPLTGKAFSQWIFGLGVLGMAVSTIIVLMLINGYAVCEILGLPPQGRPFLLAALLPGLSGCLAPFLWTGGDAQAAIAVPASVIAGALLPIAYFTFFLLMNSRALLGPSSPSGGKRVLWNVVMTVAACVAAAASVWVLRTKMLGAFPIGKTAIVLLALLAVAGLAGFLRRSRQHRDPNV